MLGTIFLLPNATMVWWEREKRKGEGSASKYLLLYGLMWDACSLATAVTVELKLL